MSKDSELERLKLRRMQEMQRRLVEQEKTKTADQKQLGPRDALKTILVGRAWEVLNSAAVQFPEPTRMLEAELAKMVREGRLKGPVTAEQLLWLFRSLGYDVRLETKIQVYESGEMKSLADKFRSG
ncbi:MAG TPA: DNA-binding protein [Candidatus Acidoferrum sp.]|nr:DNA-binding protein [Candidatus Acidoferrum sp.]